MCGCKSFLEYNSQRFGVWMWNQASASAAKVANVTWKGWLKAGSANGLLSISDIVLWFRSPFRLDNVKAPVLFNGSASSHLYNTDTRKWTQTAAKSSLDGSQRSYGRVRLLTSSGQRRHKTI